MDQATYDERLHRLQRLAYGAGASETDRAAALAELEALRRERATSGRATSEAPEVVSSRRGDGDTADAAAAKPLKWAIAAIAAALVIGVALGWPVGARVTDGSPSPPNSSTGQGHDASLVPVADTGALRLFETSATSADAPPDAYPRDSVAPTEYRRLLTRPDGVSLHIARLHGDAAICAVVTLPGEFTASTCTRDGMFPRSGLWVEVFIEGDLGLVRGAIQPDGTAELTPVGYVPGPLPTVDP